MMMMMMMIILFCTSWINNHEVRKRIVKPSQSRRSHRIEQVNKRSTDVTCITRDTTTDWLAFLSKSGSSGRVHNGWHLTNEEQRKTVVDSLAIHILALFVTYSLIQTTGYKWQHSRKCFRDFQTSDLANGTRKRLGEKTAVYIFFNSISFDRARYVMLARFGSPFELNKNINVWNICLTHATNEQRRAFTSAQ